MVGISGHFAIRETRDTKTLVEGFMNTTFSVADLSHLLRMPPLNDDSLGGLTFRVRSLASGESLLRQGDRFRGVYVVRDGYLKSAFLNGDDEQVVAFPVPGDPVGVGGIETQVYPEDAIALTKAEVVVVPQGQLLQMEGGAGGVREVLMWLLTRENSGKAEHVALLGRRHSIARSAAFLAYQGERSWRLGQSPRRFRLPMRLAHIGSYLGLRPETLSRAFRAFGEEGIAEVRARWVEIHDPARLRVLADGTDARIPVSPVSSGMTSGLANRVRLAWGV